MARKQRSTTISALYEHNRTPYSMVQVLYIFHVVGFLRSGIPVVGCANTYPAEILSVRNASADGAILKVGCRECWCGVQEIVCHVGCLDNGLHYVGVWGGCAEMICSRFPKRWICG